MASDSLRSHTKYNCKNMKREIMISLRHVKTACLGMYKIKLRPVCTSTTNQVTLKFSVRKYDEASCYLISVDSS